MTLGAQTEHVSAGVSLQPELGAKRTDPGAHKTTPRSGAGAIVPSVVTRPGILAFFEHRRSKGPETAVSGPHHAQRCRRRGVREDAGRGLRSWVERFVVGPRFMDGGRARAVDYVEGVESRTARPPSTLLHLLFRPHRPTDPVARRQPGRGVRSELDGVGVQRDDGGASEVEQATDGLPGYRSTLAGFHLR